MDRETELALVRQLREGDHAAFDVVFDEFHGRLFRFLARLSRRRDVAEDLADETWTRFVAHADRLQPDTRLAAWLFTVARNLFISYCRSRQLDESCGADLVGLWPVAVSAPSPFEAAAASELEQRMERAIATLPARYRELLLLIGVEGFSPAEAAAVCGVSAEALRQRLSRARALLAKELAGTTAPVMPSLSEVSR